MIENKIETPADNSMFDSFVGIKFNSSTRAYFFGTKDLPLNVGDKVVIETIRGLEVGEVAIQQIGMENYTSPLGLKPVIRLATDIDLKMEAANKRDAKFALEICRNEAAKLNLDMRLLSCEYTLDRTKVIFSYLADERVDFRELLKVLAARLHSRIELRQIGSRDKAKMIGGLGICGLPLCCSTFLNEFDGISIGRAKNQMLAINIPKLSGQCGKLICCLKYEDDVYSEERKKYPELGTKVYLDKSEYTITNVNIISGLIKIENPEDVKFMLYSDLKKQATIRKNKKDEAQ